VLPALTPAMAAGIGLVVMSLVGLLTGSHRTSSCS
jgi:hypothetical protein